MDDKDNAKPFPVDPQWGHFSPALPRFFPVTLSLLPKSFDLLVLLCLFIFIDPVHFYFLVTLPLLFTFPFLRCVSRFLILFQCQCIFSDVSVKITEPDKNIHVTEFHITLLLRRQWRKYLFLLMETIRLEPFVVNIFQGFCCFIQFPYTKFSFINWHDSAQKSLSYVNITCSV